MLEDTYCTTEENQSSRMLIRHSPQGEAGRTSWFFNDIYHLGFYVRPFYCFRILYCSDLHKMSCFKETISYTLENILSSVHVFPAKFEPNLKHLSRPEGSTRLHTATHSPLKHCSVFSISVHTFIYFFLVVREIEVKTKKI